MTDSRITPPAPAAPSGEPPAFTPVPSRKPRHDGWTVLRQQQFLAALALLGDVTDACRAVGMSGASAYNLRRRAGAESFAAAWDQALEEARDRAFAIAMDRTVNGVTVPRFYNGRFVGTTHRFDHRTIMTALMPRAVPPYPGSS